MRAGSVQLCAIGIPLRPRARSSLRTGRPTPPPLPAPPPYPEPMRRRPAALALILAAALPLAGCAARPTDATFAVPAGAYPAAFDATVETLRDFTFELDRIDAAGGVVTSEPRATAGLLTPWDPQQATFSQELRDALHRHARTVRVTFEPRYGANGPARPDAPPPDLRRTDEPLLARVTVTLERTYRPNVRVETESIRMNSTFRDPALARRGMQPSYTVAVRRDDAFAAKLAAAIESHLARREPAAD